MSGVEKITARLNEETAAQCEEILAAAKNKAAEIVARAQAEGNETIRAAEAEAKKRADQILASAVSQSAANARKAMLAAKVDLINEVLEKAKQSLHDLSDEAYFNALAGLARKNRRDGVGEMLMCERDLRRMPKDFIDKLGYGVKVSPIPVNIEDGFILKYGEIEQNCTFSALFSAFSQELQARAASLLFDTNGEPEAIEREGNDVLFSFLHQHGEEPFNDEGYTPLVTDLSVAAESCRYFDLETFLIEKIDESYHEEYASVFASLSYNEQADAYMCLVGATNVIAGAGSDYYNLVNPYVSWVTLLPIEDSEELNDGDYWLDLEGILMLDGLQESEEGEAYRNAKYFLSEDANTLTVILDGETNPILREDNELLFCFLHQHGEAPANDEGYVTVIRNAADVTEGCWYFDFEGLLEDRYTQYDPPVTEEEQQEDTAFITGVYTNYILLYNETDGKLKIRVNATEMIFT